MVCDVPLFRSSSSLVEVLHEKQSNIHFDSQLPDFWVVMNIINGIAREGSACALVSPSLAPEEWTLWERNTCKCGIRWGYTQMCAIGVGLKGLINLTNVIDVSPQFQSMCSEVIRNTSAWFSNATFIKTPALLPSETTLPTSNFSEDFISFCKVHIYTCYYWVCWMANVSTISTRSTVKICLAKYLK